MLLTADHLKSLHLRAVNSLSGRPIVFHHVPKCGGTSVGRALRRAYFLSQATVKPHESAEAFEAVRRPGQQLGDVYELREMMLLYFLYCGTRCVAAHVPFSTAAFERFGDKYSFVTILRDPVERLISNYYWNNRHSGDRGTTGSIDQFLDTEDARRSGSTYVRYFCGNPGRQSFSAEDIRAAITNLRRMDCVGFLDDLASFEAALHRLTGRRLRIGKENVGKKSGRSAALLTGPLREKILDRCSADREIWDAVQDLRSAAREPGAGLQRRSELNGPAATTA